jgi:hypothetical protein
MSAGRRLARTLTLSTRLKVRALSGLGWLAVAGLGAADGPQKRTPEQ